MSNRKSTLQEVVGIPASEETKSLPVQKIKTHRGKNLSVAEYVKKIRKGDITFLSKAITLVESNHPKHQTLARKLVKKSLPYSGKSIRIGITGIPGVGKSTFIETFGNYLTQLGKKIAVLTIDPSSSINKGSILGDKTRMPTLIQNPNAYIRPSATGETLGGVTKKTRETILLCESAGYDTILVETVGVGQSEVAVQAMVDFFLLLKLPDVGDELQGIKRGILEMADGIVINKADGDNMQAAQMAKKTLENALHFSQFKEAKQPKVLLCSALHHTGIPEIWDLIRKNIDASKKEHSFEKRRLKQNEYWFYSTVNEGLVSKFYTSKKIQKELKKQLKLLAQRKTTPYESASVLLSMKP